MAKAFIKVALFEKIPVDPDLARRMRLKWGSNWDDYANISKGRYYMSKLTNTEELIANWIYSIAGAGYFYVLAWRKKKCTDGKVRICYGKKLFKLEIWSEAGTMTYEFETTKGLRTYDFWRNKLIPISELYDHF